MPFTIFHVRALDPDTDALNAFLATHAVLRVEREFVADGANSFWSFCVHVADGGDAAPKGTAKPKRGVDYRELLSPEDFAVFARLRTLRNALAEQQGSPPYAIFTNEQLAHMAQLDRALGVTRAQLAAIDGIGVKRLELYADAVLAVLGASHA